MTLNLTKLTKYYRPAIYLAAVILLLTLVCTFLYWDFYHKKQDTIARLLPANTQLYLHLDYPSYLTSGSRQSKLLEYLFNDFGAILPADGQLRITDIKTNLDREIALVLTEQGQWLLIAKINDHKTLTEKLSGQAKMILINKKYLIVSPDAQTIKNLSQNKNQLTLADKLPWLKNYDSNFLKIYLQSRLAMNLAPSKQTKDLIQEYIKKNGLDRLYLSLDQNLNFFLQVNQNFAPGAKLLTSTLPANTLLTIATDNAWSFLEKTAAKLQTVSGKDWSRFLALNSPDQKNIDLNLSDLVSLLNRPLQLILTKGIKDEPDYLIVLPNITTTDQQKVEKIIQTLAAKQYPQKITRTLSDGTKVNELLSDPDLYRWTETKVGDKIIKTTGDQAGDWKIAYTVAGQNLIIATNHEDLAKLIREERNINLDQKCLLTPLANFYLTLDNWLNSGFLAKYKEIFTGLTANVNDNIAFGCLN